MSHQLVLDFKGFADTYTYENFFPSPSNQEAYTWVQAWPVWSAPIVLFYGPKGCGKTHLSYIWQEKARAIRITLAQALQDSTLSQIGEAHQPAVVMENVHTCQGQRLQEEALLHLYNVVQQAQGCLLLTAETPPGQWSFVVPDLSSRLRSIPSIEISPPDDLLLRALIVKLFSDHQIKVEENVIHYLLTHGERSFVTLQEVVEQLIHKALTRRRPIRLALVKEVLHEKKEDLTISQ